MIPPPAPVPPFGGTTNISMMTDELFVLSLHASMFVTAAPGRSATSRREAQVVG